MSLPKILYINIQILAIFRLLYSWTGSPDNKSTNVTANDTVGSPLTSSPLGDLSRRYKYTQQQRGESLRRTQSITSNSSRESDYIDMRRMEQDRNYQTEWKRLRAMEGGHAHRPLSIGSDVSSLEGMHLNVDSDIIHRRSSSETLPKHVSVWDKYVRQKCEQITFSFYKG